MKRLVNLVIGILLIIFVGISGYTYLKYKSLKKESQQIKITNDTKNDTRLVNINSFVTKLHKENSLLVLSGEINVQAEYTNEEISDDDVNFKWIKDWFANINSKSLIIEATYSFQFFYDLKDMNIQLVEDRPSIHLSNNRLSTSVEFIENKSFYTDRIGLLESQFTPQEVNSINARTKELVLNRVQSDKKLRNQSIVNTMESIDNLLNVECLFSTSNLDVIQQDNNIKLND